MLTNAFPVSRREPRSYEIRDTDYEKRFSTISTVRVRKNPYAYNKTKILKSVFVDLKEQGNKLIFIVVFAQKRLNLRKI